MGIFSRYDQWLTTPPEYPDPPMPGDPFYPRCSACGAWLRLEPDKLGYGEQTEDCNGKPHELYEFECGEGYRAHAAHKFVAHAWGIEYRKCKRCGHNNETITA